MHNRSCFDVCVSRVLFQIATCSLKHCLKNFVKLQQSKWFVVLLVTNMRFVQRRSLLQDVVKLGIGAELTYRSVSSTIGTYFGIGKITCTHNLYSC